MTDEVRTKTGPKGPVELAREEAMRGDESWQLESWATGPEGAVKLTVLVRSEPGVMVLQDLRARLSGQYRLQYQEWPQRFGHKATKKEPT